MHVRDSLAKPQHVVIAANPKSGAGPSGSRIAELQGAITAAGYQCRVEHSLEALLEQCIVRDRAGDLRAVVSAGGDGTAEALANILPSHVPLLLFPLGTENLLAKHLRITGDVRQACDILHRDQRLALDVGSANGKLFLVMLSCGFDAEVVRRMHAVRTGHINRWSYARPILSSLLGYRFPQLGWSVGTMPGEMPAQGQPVDAEQTLRHAAWLFVFNVPRYAAALNFCPQADPTDGLLDVCTFQCSGIVAGFGYLARLWHGSHQRMRGFSHTRCGRLEIPAPIDNNGRTLDVPYQLDGDPGGLLPLKIEVLPARLTLLVPETPAA